jgi:hypothetical protein
MSRSQRDLLQSANRPSPKLLTFYEKLVNEKKTKSKVCPLKSQNNLKQVISQFVYLYLYLQRASYWQVIYIR